MAIRKLEAPAVQWQAREQVRYEKGQRRNPPIIPPLELFDKRVQVVNGRADVDEALPYAVSLARGGLETRPLWHVLVQDLHFRDVTAPEIAPEFPLPPDKPHRVEADREAQNRLSARASRALLGRR